MLYFIFWQDLLAVQELIQLVDLLNNFMFASFEVKVCCVSYFKLYFCLFFKSGVAIFPVGFYRDVGCFLKICLINLIYAKKNTRLDERCLQQPVMGEMLGHA